MRKLVERLHCGPDSLPEDQLPAVVMFDINGKDVERTRTFYSNVFGWTISIPGDAPVRLATVEAGIGGIDGVIGQAPSLNDPDAGERHTGLTIYVKVQDVAASLAAAIENGATSIWGPTEVAPGFWLAQFEDPDGVRIGLST